MHQETLSITGCIRSEHRGDLGVIHQPEYQAGLWERPLSFSAQSEAERLLDSGWESFRFSGSVDELSEKLEATELSEFWKTEVKDQAEWFAELMGDLPIRLFFGKVEKDMCRRFHTDINTLRLLCTYIGPGTLWVSPEAIDHSQVAKGSNEEMVKDQQGIHQAGTGDILLIKGALNEESINGAVLHRSPPVQEKGESRLLLRIDTGGAFNFL